MGKLTIISIIPPDQSIPTNKRRTKCIGLCECGNKITVSLNSIKTGNTKSCGCEIGVISKKRFNLTGKKFGRLLVIEQTTRPSQLKKQQRYWKCTCECGNEVICVSSNLKNGNTKSCGCLGFEHLNGIHYSERNPELDRFRPVYSSINKRNDTLKRKRKYKTCSITLEDLNAQWEKQKGKCPFTGVDLLLPGWYSAKDYLYRASIDRIDSSKGYEVGNIQFVSVMINYAKNKFDNDVMIEFCKTITNFWNTKNQIESRFSPL